MQVEQVDKSDTLSVNVTLTQVATYDCEQTTETDCQDEQPDVARNTM